MNHLDTEEALLHRARRAVIKALRMYDDVAGLLARRVKAIVAEDSDTQPLSDHERELIRDHQKIILMVLELEAKLLKHRGAEPGHGGSDLDLAAARAEVAGRLDRLAVSRGARELD